MEDVQDAVAQLRGKGTFAPAWGWEGLELQPGLGTEHSWVTHEALAWQSL